jgi:RecB family endonuclease NucS
MADLLALDTSGNLIIIEIKRDWSNHKTIGQLLEYAAKFKDFTVLDLLKKLKK